MGQLSAALLEKQINVAEKAPGRLVIQLFQKINGKSGREAAVVLNLHMDPCYLCCFCVHAWAIQTCYLGRSQQGDPDSEISHCTHLMTVDIRQNSAHNSTYSPFWVATLPFYAFRSIFFSFFLFPFWLSP